MFDDFWKAIFEQLGNVLPFLGILIVGVSFWLIGSTGVFLAGGKISEKAKNYLSFLGIILTIIGLFTTVISISLLFWDFLIPYQSNLSYLWKLFSTLFSWVNLAIVVALILIIYVTNMVYQKRIEKEYKLKIIPVLIQNYIVALQIENIGKGNFPCIARLTDISTVKGNQSIDIYSVNPQGLFLRWDDERESAFLQENIPRTVNLVRIMENYNPPTVKFMFSNRGYSNSITKGEYLVKISFYRMYMKKQIKMKEIEGIFFVQDGYKPIIGWKKES